MAMVYKLGQMVPGTKANEKITKLMGKENFGM